MGDEDEDDFSEVEVWVVETFGSPLAVVLVFSSIG